MQRQAYELQTDAAEPEVHWPQHKPLSSLHLPTLVLIGEDDRPDFHAIATRVANEAPDARLEVVPGARHFPSLEEPDEFERLVFPFLGAANG